MSAIIFNGKNAKLLTSGDLVNGDGQTFSKYVERNYVTNPSGAVNTTGWTPTGTMTVTRVTSGVPRASLGYGLQFAAGAAADYVRFRFTVDSADQAKKLKIAFDMVPGSYTAGDMKVDLYATSDSTYATGLTRQALSTDTSAVTALPNATGSFRTTFDASSTLIYCELRVVRVAGTSTLTLSDTVVGPGTVIQGAAVSDWQSYTPTVTGRTTNPTQGTGTTKASWRRVGSVMEIQYSFIQTALGSAAAGSGDYLWSIPSGYTINTSIIDNTSSQYASNAVGSAQVYFGGGPGQEEGSVQVDGNNLILITGANTVNSTPIGSAHRPFSENAAQRYSFSARIPINEWAGNGTVNVAVNDVEYAYNTSTANADDTSSFGWGLAGNTVPSVTLEHVRRVRFNSPVSITDKLAIEVSLNGGPWNDISLAARQNAICPYTYQNGVGYGIGLSESSTGTATDVDVYFAQYAAPSGATYGAAGSAWSGLTTYKWRVRKMTGGQAVGFGIVQPGVASGLVSASGVPGNPGNTVATTYVGERVGFNSRAMTGVSSTWANNAAALVTLQPGVWLLIGTFLPNTANNTSGMVDGALGTSATAGSGLYTQNTYSTYSAFATSFTVPMVPEYVVVAPGSTQAIYANMYCYNAAVNGSITGYAVRIA